MSGGYFNYGQYDIYGQFNMECVADAIGSLIDNNVNYSDETIEKFRLAEKTVRQAAIMVHRIDSLVSYGDCEDTFHARWKEDLAALERKSQ